MIKLKNMSLGLLAFATLCIDSANAMQDRFRHMNPTELRTYAREWANSHDAIQPLAPIINRDLARIKAQAVAELSPKLDAWLKGLRAGGGAVQVLVNANREMDPGVGNNMRVLDADGTHVASLFAFPVDEARNNLRTYLAGVLGAAANNLTLAGIGLGGTTPVTHRSIQKAMNQIDAQLAKAVEDHILGLYNTDANLALDAAVKAVDDLVALGSINLIHADNNAGIAAAVGLGAGATIDQMVRALKTEPGNAAAAANAPGGGGLITALGNPGQIANLQAAIVRAIRDENASGITNYPDDHTSLGFAESAYRILTQQ